MLEITGGMLAGEWRAQACQLTLGEGEQDGEATVTGDCPGRLPGAARWRLEPLERKRLDLHDATGEVIWFGLMIKPGELAGMGPGAPSQVWTRSSADGSTQGARRP